MVGWNKGIIQAAEHNQNQHLKKKIKGCWDERFELPIIAVFSLMGRCLDLENQVDKLAQILLT